MGRQTKGSAAPGRRRKGRITPCIHGAALPCCTGDPGEPALTEKYVAICEISACTRRALCLNTASRQTWPVRLSVRTPGFQPGKRGSIPLRAATSPPCRSVLSALAASRSPPAYGLVRLGFSGASVGDLSEARARGGSGDGLGIICVTVHPAINRGALCSRN